MNVDCHSLRRLHQCNLIEFLSCVSELYFLYDQANCGGGIISYGKRRRRSADNVTLSEAELEDSETFITTISTTIRDKATEETDDKDSKLHSTADPNFSPISSSSKSLLRYSSAHSFKPGTHDAEGGSLPHDVPVSLSVRTA